jgi:uncharacterized protein
MRNEDFLNRTALTDFLLEASSYPHNPERVEHIQTHASDVFIATPYVYKVKKPVDFGFLDFTTLEKRKYYLEQEIHLNRRLTSGIYLGVLEISLTEGKYKFGPGDETVEYALLMKEFPKNYFLKTLLKEGKASKNDFNNIALKLVKFYQSQSLDPTVTAHGDPENVKRDVYESISLSRDFITKTVSDPALGAIEFYNDSFFETRFNLFRDRMDENFIKDCHGDLHLEHINISPEGINIYDCIEFNERFRYIDIASDTAFLAMDLDFNGYFDYSHYFISRISGLMPDKGLFRLLDFYKCYRALVRGKVLSIKAFEPEVSDSIRDQTLQNAKRYYKLTLRYALLGSRPSLLVTFGSIGTGKSTLASTLSNELSCRVVSSDALRKETAGAEPGERRYEEYESGIYSKESTEHTYNELIERGIEIINTGKGAVLDASFSKLKSREHVRRAASKHKISVYFIQTWAPNSVIRERLLQRELLGGSISDGRLEILESFTRDFEEPRELVDENLITVDTTEAREIQLANLFKRLVQINLETEYGYE